MDDPVSNDNDVPRADDRPDGPDAHGRAAILLVESLIHGLIAQSIISVGDAVEIVGVAADVQKDVAAEVGDSRATMNHSLTILAGIRASLEIDL